MESVKSGGSALIEPESMGNAITAAGENDFNDFVVMVIQSLWGFNWYIAVVAFVAVICLAICLYASWSVKEPCSRRSFLGLRFFNKMFIALTSMFPQLGILGTVASLLLLNFDALGSSNDVLAQFTNALTSTAAGLGFFILFNALYALFEDFIETKIEEAQRLAAASEVGRRR